MQAREIFSAYLQDYFEEVSLLDYEDVRRHQRALVAGLAFGVAGISYACWHAGYILAKPELLDQAERWIRPALRAQYGAVAFGGAKAKPMPSYAYLYGRAGLYFTRALVAHSREDRRARYQAVTRFVEMSLPSLDGPADLYAGSAGCLAGAAILLRHIEDPRLRPLGERLALSLLAGLERQNEERGDLGLAHGTAGSYLAVLLWASAAEIELPVWLSCRLTRFLQTALGDPGRLGRQEVLSWLCNGFTGLALLAAKAFQVLKDPWFLTAASDSARLALAHLSPRADLCCGRAGIAYACLALSRFDAGGPWRRHAEELTLSTLLVPRESWTFIGLYGGEAAIPCLVSSLLEGLPSGPPCLDFVEL